MCQDKTTVQRVGGGLAVRKIVDRWGEMGVRTSTQRWSCQRTHKAILFLFHDCPRTPTCNLHEILMCSQVLASSLKYESHAIQKMVKLLLWSYVSLMIWPVKKDRGEHVPPSQDSISKSNNVKHSQLPPLFYSCHHNSGLVIYCSSS